MSAKEAEEVRRIVDWATLVGCLVCAVVGLVSHSELWFRFTLAFAFSFLVFEGTIAVMTWRWR